MSTHLRTALIIITLIAACIGITCALVTWYFNQQALTVVEQSKTNYLEIPNS